jgi:hypothetical protein
MRVECGKLLCDVRLLKVKTTVCIKANELQ